MTPEDDALAEILEAAGIPRPTATERTLKQRDGYAVVGPGVPNHLDFKAAMDELAAAWKRVNGRQDWKPNTIDLRNVTS